MDAPQFEEELATVSDIHIGISFGQVTSFSVVAPRLTSAGILGCPAYRVSHHAHQAVERIKRCRSHVRLRVSLIPRLTVPVCR